MIRDPMTQVGFTMSDHDGEFIVDAQRAKRVEFALDYIMRRKVEIGCVKVLSEVHVDPVSLFGRSDLAGTCDVILEGEDVLEIIDYKDGMGVVSAKNNEQMEQYLIGYLATNKPRPKIRMTIIQPKLREKGMTGIDYYEISADDVPAIQLAIMLQAAATDDPEAPLVPGEEQCKYCKHKGACVALNSKSLASLDIASVNVAQAAADKEPTTMTDDQIRQMVEAAPLIRQTLEAVEQEAFRRMQNGVSIAGLKLVRGRGSREWAFPEDEMVEKLKKLGLPKDACYTHKLISPAQAEKAVWTNRAGEKLQIDPVKLAKMKSEYVKTTEGKLTVVAASDERPAANVDASSMFSAVTPDLPDFLK